MEENDMFYEQLQSEAIKYNKSDHLIIAVDLNAGVGWLLSLMMFLSWKIKLKKNKRVEFNLETHMAYIDYEKAFDSIVEIYDRE